MTIEHVILGLAFVAAYAAVLLLVLALCNISGRISREEEAEERRLHLQGGRE